MAGEERNWEFVLRQVDVGGCPVQFVELGGGHPVLMLHGGGPGASGVSNYSRNFTALARHFRVIIPDMPGYGDSGKVVNREDPFGGLAAYMTGLLDILNLPAVHVVGNSLGGAVALRMALDTPARVSSLVLMGPGGLGTSRSLPTRGLRQLLGYYTGDGPSLEKLSAFIRESLVYDGAAVPDELIEARYRASIDPEVIAAPPLQRPSSLRTLRAMDFTRDPRLARCTIRTLVLWGTEDRVNRPSGARALQRRMPNCDVYLFSRTGHWVQWERAIEFNACVAAFLLAGEPAGDNAKDEG
ncbi:MAG: alpha/beta fold hydrolase [Halieaceae bacterium]|nr:alpha/beta fold hydrolase [Halieaceae bacterium]